MNNEYELYHYGVLGMKWGVRKSPVRSYIKATNKRKKLQSNAERDRLAANEAKYKYLKALAREQKFIPKQIARGMRFTTAVPTYKRAYDKAEAKAIKSEVKSQKWNNRMDETFSEENLGKLHDKYLKTANDYFIRSDRTTLPANQTKYYEAGRRYLDQADYVLDLINDPEKAVKYYKLMHPDDED